jgi:hypothetical protein
LRVEDLLHSIYINCAADLVLPKVSMRGRTMPEIADVSLTGTRRNVYAGYFIQAAGMTPSPATSYPLKTTADMSSRDGNWPADPMSHAKAIGVKFAPVSKSYK